MVVMWFSRLRWHSYGLILELLPRPAPPPPPLLLLLHWEHAMEAVTIAPACDPHCLTMLPTPMKPMVPCRFGQITTQMLHSDAYSALLFFSGSMSAARHASKTGLGHVVSLGTCRRSHSRHSRDSNSLLCRCCTSGT